MKWGGDNIPNSSLSKQLSLCSPLGTFHQERCLSLSDRNSILMTKINDYIIKPVNPHRAPNVICLILCFSRSILVNFCVLLRTSSSEAQMLILKRNIFHEYWLFCDTSVDSSCLHLTFVAFCHFVCHSLTIAKNNVTTMLTIQSSWPDSGQILHHQYRNSVTDAHCLS